MEFDREYVKQKIMNIPGVREAIRKGDYQEVFTLCKTTKKQMNLARALLSSKVDFLSKLTEIPDSLFRESPLISGKLVIPPNIKKIGELAFFGTEINELELSEGLEEIGDGAFAQTKVREVILPSTVKKLGRLSLGRANITLNMENIDSIKGGKHASLGFYIDSTTGEKRKFM